MPREKSRYRDRRSSSYSSESSYERKKAKSKHKRRSISRERESNSLRRKRSTSRPRRKRSYSRSTSRDRYDKSRKRSASRSRSKRDRSRSRSSSRSRKHKSSRKSRRHSHSSSSRSSSYDIGNEQEWSEELSNILSSLMQLNLKARRTPILSTYFSKRPQLPKKVNLDDTESKVEKAIKAAEAVGLTMTKIPTYEYKEVEIKEDMPTIHDRNLLAELNSDTFIQRPFVSSKKKESKNIVIDLNTQTVKLPETEVKEKDDSIIDFNEIPSEEELRENWIKKLYQYRKKMLKGEI
uniref:Uncharacterized protein n=1 Tax=Pectinophora gossypiella TaxID=13191 RepID=A0A1E1WR83_PECGO